MGIENWPPSNETRATQDVSVAKVALWILLATPFHEFFKMSSTALALGKDGAGDVESRLRVAEVSGIVGERASNSEDIFRDLAHAAPPVLRSIWVEVFMLRPQSGRQPSNTGDMYACHSRRIRTG